MCTHTPHTHGCPSHPLPVPGSPCSAPPGAGTWVGWGWVVAGAVGTGGRRCQHPACTLTSPSPPTLGCRHDRAEDAEQQVPGRGQSGHWEGNAAAAGAGPGHAGGGGKTPPPKSPHPPRAHGCSRHARGGDEPPHALGEPCALLGAHTCSTHGHGSVGAGGGGVLGLCPHPLAPTRWLSPPAQPLRGRSCLPGGRPAGELHGHPG